jgi:peptidoglycan/xylan/chitin deacetylase (PgdA/CDA1 family)
MQFISTRIIRNIIGWFIAEILVVTGNINKAKKASFQQGVILPIYFHNPDKKFLKMILVWLKKNGYVFISCDQLIEILHQHVPCPKGAVWLSFDDGWKDNIINVIPLAQEYDIPVTIFIYTSAIETGAFWWKKLDKYADRLPEEYRGFSKVSRLSEDSRKHVLQLMDRMDVFDSLERDAMTLEELKQISAIPQVTIGSHTVTHPLFENCNNDQIDKELGESKKKLEDWIGKPVKAFAYPGGSFTREIKPLLKKHGYELAATITNRFAKIDDDCYSFPRTDVMDDGSFTENLCHALGVWEPFINRFKHFIRPVKTH